MIAFGVLGMGLLIIGAALPIGVRYTEDSVNLATGEAAAEYALNMIEQNVSLAHRIADADGDQIRAPVLFQPRLDNNHASPPDTLEGDADWEYEPLIKVRPLFTANVLANSGYYGNQGDQFQVDLAGMVAQSTVYLPAGPDVTDAAEWGWGVLRPALSPLAMVYPPIAVADGPYDPWLDYLNSDDLKYDAREVSFTDMRKALERRVTWTAFYRRLSYEENVPASLYEFIVVVTRRPSASHRYPLQALGRGGFSAAPQRSGVDKTTTSASYDGQDTLAPVPWLVWFDGLPQNNFGWDDGMPEDDDSVLRFTCNTGLDEGLFPVGSVFIPARNDLAPNSLASGGSTAHVGFGPPAPRSLPIYKVIERPDATTVIVENNGYYPVQHPNSVGGPYYTADPAQWPVWVVPPAFAEESGGDPVFGDRSHVLAVARRVISLPTVESR